MTNHNILFYGLFTILLVSFSSSVFCQEKYEKESKLKEAEVPAQALEFLEKLNFNTKIKWYSEVGLERKTIEAKFKYMGDRYSVEYDADGNIEDVEIEMKWNELDEKLKSSVDSTLNTICERHKIAKVQIQYLGSQQVLLAKLKDGQLTEGLSTNFEIVSTCVNDNNIDQFEYLFNNEGILLNTSKIVFKNSSNLEY